MGLLSDCHRRIEMFLGVLQGIAGVIDRPLSEENAKALDSALQYFRQAAPKHNADEEESLFPRMRRIRQPEMRSAIAKVEGLEKDHRWAAPLHEEIERLGRIRLSGSSLTGTEIAMFREAVDELAEMYREHIRVEDEAVFPVAARLLPDADRKAIGEEMAVRRNIRPTGAGAKPA
jgi:hemerythrin-like domain-containing protein